MRLRCDRGEPFNYDGCAFWESAAAGLALRRYEIVQAKHENFDGCSKNPARPLPRGIAGIAPATRIPRRWLRLAAAASASAVLREDKSNFSPPKML